MGLLFVGNTRFICSIDFSMSISDNSNSFNPQKCEASMPAGHSQAATICYTPKIYRAVICKFKCDIKHATLPFSLLYLVTYWSSYFFLNLSIIVEVVVLSN